MDMFREDLKKEEERAEREDRHIQREQLRAALNPAKVKYQQVRDVAVVAYVDATVHGESLETMRNHFKKGVELCNQALEEQMTKPCRDGGVCNDHWTLKEQAQ